MNMTLINHTEFNAQKGRVFQTSHHRHALKIICVLCLYCLALQSSFAAEPVSATAQVNLAFNYQQAKNYPEAAKWYRKAAEQGNASAQLALAQLYEEGNGVLKDNTEAANWYRKAYESYYKLAVQGDAEAQFWLGTLYEGGNGIKRDYVEAVKWYRKAAEHSGFMGASAQSSLAACYERGKGVEKDIVEAYKWYNLANAGGESSAAIQRDYLAETMTPEQISEGQKRASEFAAKWKAKSR